MPVQFVYILLQNTGIELPGGTTDCPFLRGHTRSEEQILFDPSAGEWRHKQEGALCFSASLALVSLDLLCWNVPKCFA